VEAGLSQKGPAENLPAVEFGDFSYRPEKWTWLSGPVAAFFASNETERIRL
jgi:hypothetical protein